MAEAKERSEWNRFAVLVAKLHNINQTQKSDLISFEDVHPFFIEKQRTSVESTARELTMLKGAVQGLR